MKYLKKALLVMISGICFSACQKTQVVERDVQSNPYKKGAINVAVLVYPGVELLDVVGPAEVFSDAEGFNVYTVCTTRGKISTQYKTLHLNPDYTIENAPQPEILVVPGAMLATVDKIWPDKNTLAWIKRTNNKTQFTMSVCTGAKILSKAGILDHKTATTHWYDMERIRKASPKTRFVTHTRFVEDGKIMTTAGISAGIDGALHIVDKLRGRKAAIEVTRTMEYDKWDPESGLIVGKNKMAKDNH